MSTPRILLALALAACTDGVSEGTSVGNPSIVQFKTADGGDVALNTGSLTVDSLQLIGTTGWEDEVIVDEPLDALEGGEIDMPGGAWREVIVVLSGNITYEGTTPNGYTADLVLTVPDVRLRPGEDDAIDTIDETFLMELAFPGWLNFDFTSLTDDRDLRVRPGTLVHDRLAKAIRDQSALFPDPDRDGRITDEQRERPRGAGRDRPPPPMMPPP